MDEELLRTGERRTPCFSMPSRFSSSYKRSTTNSLSMVWYPLCFFLATSLSRLSTSSSRRREMGLLLGRGGGSMSSGTGSALSMKASLMECVDQNSASSASVMFSGISSGLYISFNFLRAIASSPPVAAFLAVICVSG